MRRFTNTFILSLSFLVLVGLAFNPHIVVKLQEALGFGHGTLPNNIGIIPDEEDDTPLTKTDKPSLLPITAMPDIDTLPRIKGFEKIAKNDDWIGDTPCGTVIFDVPTTLPNLGPQEDGGILESHIRASYGQKISNQPTYLYKSQNGVTLRLVKPAIKYYNVSGENFRAAQKDIFESKPLKRPEDSLSENDPSQDKRKTTTLANISYPTTLSYHTYGSGSQYKLLPEKTIMTAAFLVTLPKWETYETSSSKDQARWDDLLCKASHHELGHLRIHLDILAETLDGYASLPIGQPKAEIERQIKIYREDIDARIQNRQDIYHIYNDGGIRRGMIELPYAELPLPWLKDQSVD